MSQVSPILATPNAVWNERLEKGKKCVQKIINRMSQRVFEAEQADVFRFSRTLNRLNEGRLNKAIEVLQSVSHRTEEFDELMVTLQPTFQNYMNFMCSPNLELKIPHLMDAIQLAQEVQDVEAEKTFLNALHSSIYCERPYKVPFLPPYSDELKEFLSGPCSFVRGLARQQTHVVVPLVRFIKYAHGYNCLTVAHFPWMSNMETEIIDHQTVERTFRWGVFTSQPFILDPSNLPQGYTLPTHFDLLRALFYTQQTWLNNGQAILCRPLSKQTPRLVVFSLKPFLHITSEQVMQPHSICTVPVRYFE